MFANSIKNRIRLRFFVLFLIAIILLLPQLLHGTPVCSEPELGPSIESIQSYEWYCDPVLGTLSIRERERNPVKRVWRNFREFTYEVQEWFSLANP